MAGPEVPQKGALNIGYDYRPSVYQPQNIQIPMGAGALWAQVGQTALAASKQAGDMIQNSRLNPAFAAQQDYQQTQYDAAADHLAWLASKGNAGQMTETVGPGGISTVAGAGTDIDPQVRLALRSSKPAVPLPAPPTTTTTTKDGTTPAPTPTTGVEQPSEGYSASAAVTGAAPPAPSTGTSKPGAQPKKTHTPGDELTDDRSASTDDYLMRMRTERKLLGLDSSDAAQQGTPPGMTYTNPATGNVEPLKTEAPSVFAARGPGQPPPAPGGQPQPDTSQTPAAATQSDAANMAKWQAQNAQQGVMSSQDALAWMKSQTTLAQDATYLPMGGPGGSPAYAFHMKGGGINTVPVSQMVAKGAGPLVAAQNTSMVMSQTDQAQGGDQGYSQSAATTPAAPPQPQPQIAAGPPAAPGGMPSGTGAGAPQGLAGPPPAPGAYNAAAYQMPQGSTVTQNGQVNPALMAGGSNEQALAASRPSQPPIPQIDDPTDFNANVRGYSQDALDKMKKDPVLSDDYGGFQWRQDRIHGTKYAVMSSPEPFHELRWNAGRDSWDNYWVENGQLMKQVQDARAGTPLAKMVSDTDIQNMSEEDLKDTLDRAVRLKTTGGDASDTNSLHIRGTINQSQSLGRTIAMLEAAKKEGIDPKLFNTGAQESSEEAAKREAMLPPAGEEYPAYKTGFTTPPDAPLGLGNPYNQTTPQFHGIEWGGPGGTWDLGWAASHGMRAARTGGNVSPLADQLKAETKYFSDQMGETPGIKYTSESPEQPKVSVSGGYQGIGGSVNVPLPKDPSTLKEINRISQGTNIDDMIAGAKQLKKKIDGDVADSIDEATRLNYRTPPQFKKAAEAIKNGKNIEDPNNQFIDQNGNSRMPDRYKNPPGMTSKVPTGGGPNTQVQDEMKRFYGNGGPPVHQVTSDDDYDKLASGQLYQGPDGVTRMK